MNEFVLKVMSYNIASGHGMDHVGNYARAAKVIAEYKPDIVGLQELTVNSYHSPGLDPVKYYESALGMRGVFGKTIDIGGGKREYGIGILAKKEFRFLEKLPLSAPDNVEPRACLAVEIETPFGPLFFLNTHLVYEPELPGVRLEQMKKILKMAAEKNYFPAILTGDFNAQPSEPVIGLLESEGWIITDKSIKTFPADKPEIKIDYICMNPASAFSFADYRVLDEPAASDHRPVMAEVTVKFK